MLFLKTDRAESKNIIKDLLKEQNRTYTSEKIGMVCMIVPLLRIVIRVLILGFEEQ